LRRLKTFSGESLTRALASHEKHAAMVFELEEHVAAAVAKLKAKGLVSPYLRAFVVARINPLRWIKGDPAVARGGAGDHARARRAVQCREDQAAGPRKRRRRAG
jgi:hypothetical protein